MGAGSLFKRENFLIFGFVYDNLTVKGGVNYEYSRIC